MSFVERVLRCMTHLNIGATLACAAWVLWTGLKVVSGELSPPPRPPGLQRVPAADTAPAIGPTTTPPCPCRSEDAAPPRPLVALAVTATPRQGQR